MKLGIAGSGAIARGLARGLARAASSHGETVLWARREASAEAARAAIEEAGAVVTDLEHLADCELVVEAVAEDLEVKQDVLGRLGTLLPEPTVLATTTSSLSVTALGEASGRPDRFGGLHVFNPVEKMALVELVFADAASESTRALLRRLCEEMGKTAVEVPDSAGFVVNRLLFPYLFDAVRLLEASGLEPEAIDTCMKLGAGHPMGPLKLLDMVGLDVSAAIGDEIGVDVPERVRSLVADGQLGRKSGAGFYTY
jgi:3-hydroxybutyryl-CoA dehydrogenase